MCAEKVPFLSCVRCRNTTYIGISAIERGGLKVSPCQRCYQRHWDAKRRKFKLEMRQKGLSYFQEEWDELIAKYGGKCVRCGSKKPLIADHIVSPEKGGSDTIDNIQPLCKSCNAAKSDMVIDYRPDVSCVLSKEFLQQGKARAAHIARLEKKISDNLRFEQILRDERLAVEQELHEFLM